VTEEEQLAAEFETQRPYLHAIAFRMLEDLRGWLTTVTGRICLDALRRRGVRGEQPLELSVGMHPRRSAC
jgi:hypothetical protein